MKIELVPSILASNFAQLASDAQQAIDGGGTLLHVDVMDGHFVPNITLGPPFVASLRKAVKVPLDCHLMIENPDFFIPEFAEAGANWISVHQEACIHLDRTLHLIALHGCKPGVVINPATPVEMLTEVLDLVHHVLVMSINPGFGGQKFIPNALNRIAALARPSADRDEPTTHSALEEELANEGTGRAAGRPTFGTTEEADRGQGGRHPGGHRRASPRFHHALVHASVGATFGLEQRHGHARLAQGRAATSSTAAVHGQPGYEL